jgi:3-hydroxyisobutyrate dehydrogenase
MNQTSTVAFLGTGIMGGPMARNCAAAGLRVRAWNRTPEKAQALADAGVTPAGTPAEAARAADALVTMLADGDAVEAVMTGDDGALAAMGDDAVWLQMSTVGVAATDRLAGLAAERGVAYVDAPVVGTRQPAERGELVVLASAPEELRDRAAPVFDAVGRATRWVGEAPGAGSRLKLVFNGWLVSLVESLSETLAFSRAMGIPPEQFLEAIDGTPMGFDYAQLKGRTMAAMDFSEVAFPLRLAHKDARLVLEAAEAEGLELPLMRTAEAQFARAEADGHGDEDLAAVHHAVRAG